MANSKSGSVAKRRGVVLGDHSVSISHLHLDPLNPRHEPLQGDTEVIAQLCNAEMVAELAQDIAARGALSPLNVLGVVPFEGHPGHFVTLEGNRRTCALILLADPSRAPTAALRTQMSRIAASAKVPDPIKIHVFADRESAKPWIDQRHLGSQGGVGTLEWDADQKTRAAGGNTRTSSRANTLALAVLDRLVLGGMLTSDQRKKVSLTTITRYLGTPGVRAIIGLESPNDLIYTHDSAEVDAALLRLVLDSIEQDQTGSFAVNSRSGSSDRLAYANSLKQAGVAPSTPLAVPDAPIAASISPVTAKVPYLRPVPNPANLPTLFDSTFRIAHRDPVLQRLRKECRELQIKDFPFSGNYLLRAMVEQIMVLFAKKRGKYSTSMSDEALTQACANEVKAMGVTGKALSVLNKAAGSAATPYSLHSLGHAVHGGAIPTQQGLRALADTWLPSLQVMLGAL